MLAGMASKITKKHTYKCVNPSRHNGIKGTKVKSAHWSKFMLAHIIIWVYFSHGSLDSVVSWASIEHKINGKRRRVFYSDSWFRHIWKNDALNYPWEYSVLLIYLASSSVTYTARIWLLNMHVQYKNIHMYDYTIFPWSLNQCKDIVYSGLIAPCLNSYSKKIIFPLPTQNFMHSSWKAKKTKELFYLMNNALDWQLHVLHQITITLQFRDAGRSKYSMYRDTSGTISPVS